MEILLITKIQIYNEQTDYEIMTIVAIAYKYQEFCKLFYRIENFLSQINDDLIKLVTISCTLSNETDKAKLNNLC